MAPGRRLSASTAPQECELHVHLGGCFHLEDLLEIGRTVYDDVDWSPFREAHRRAFPGSTVDAVALFRAAIEEGDPEPLRRHYIHGDDDGPDFDRFASKFFLLICLYRHWRDVLDREAELARRAADRHRAEGVRYVEYRAAHMRDLSEDPEGFIAFHRMNALAFRDASGAGFEAKYIPSVPRSDPQVGYGLVRRLLADNPDLGETVVGIDFGNAEEGHPPKQTRAVFERLRLDNDAHPGHRLDVVYHVGEMYFDKSLESAVRWCHEAALLGARRLGHAIALGLDPEVSLGRRADAHETEIVSERLDQIDYDLRHAEGLAACGVEADVGELREERERLLRQDRAGALRRPYSAARVEGVRGRQAFVLAELERLGTAIEICPTSNRVLGGVEDPSQHSMHRLLASGVDVAIGADDPGIFDSTLAQELDWVRTHTRLTPAELDHRLGDPLRLRLRAGRT